MKIPVVNSDKSEEHPRYYQVSVYCDNCHRHYTASIPYGNKVNHHVCEYCGCSTLSATSRRIANDQWNEWDEWDKWRIPPAMCENRVEYPFRTIFSSSLPNEKRADNISMLEELMKGL